MLGNFTYFSIDIEISDISNILNGGDERFSKSRWYIKVFVGFIKGIMINLKIYPIL